ncbi:hypothetical protein QQ045_013078 [Rhodiola kirilowii]
MMNEFWDENGSTIRGWPDKLRRCKERLKTWNQSSFGNVQKKIKLLKKELEDIRMQDRNQETVEREQHVVEDLDRWLAREETLWMQRSRVLWMDHGDKNTKYFYAKASNRKQKNWFTKLKDSQGIIHEEEEKIMDIITEYFINIFQPSISRDSEAIDADLRDVSACITEDMNMELLRDISEEEIKRAVFSLGPLKAPGIDGFPAVFY